MTPRLDKTGKISGYRETGRLRVKKSEEHGSWTEVEDLKKDEKIALGDRVVRRVYREGEEESVRNYFVLLAKGGLPPDVSPLNAVNIYVNDEDIRFLGGSQCAFHDGDEILLIPAIAGGAELELFPRLR